MRTATNRCRPETATVKWLNSTKGFGFIQPDDGGPDAFIHINAVEPAGLRGLREGQKISSELFQDKRSGKASAGNLRAERSSGAGSAGCSGPCQSRLQSIRRIRLVESALGALSILLAFDPDREILGQHIVLAEQTGILELFQIGQVAQAG